MQSKSTFTFGRANPSLSALIADWRELSVKVSRTLPNYEVTKTNQSKPK